LPNKWVNGQVGGVAVDSHDNVWVFHRPATIPDGEKAASLNPPQAECCIPAPPVLEFDTNGKFLQAWGGPGQGYDWFTSEHGIFVDYKDNVWLSGSAKEDNQILKLTNKGKLLLQIGHTGKNQGSNDTANLGGPAGLFVYPKTNELFVADGYFNHRVIVFDADTGAYKRHWGAYGKKPDDKESNARTFDGEGPKQFNTVHSLRISNDDLVYVGDRRNNRIQVFKPDGTYIKESYVERKTTGEEGTTFDFAFSPDPQQQFIYIPDGTNKKVQILKRDTLEVVGYFGGHGGHGAAQFFHIHSIASDSKGNIYLGESFGKRALKWSYKGMEASR
jgi:DNA-binding beta-propeller fold protein YncE